MFRFLMSKLLHKKWMVLCLLIGNILLISVAVCYPMYKRASLNRMLSDEFQAYAEENSGYAGTMSMSFTKKKDNADTVTALENVAAGAKSALSYKLAQSITVYMQQDSKCNLVGERDDVDEMKLRITQMSDIESHIKLVAGQMFEPGQSVVQAIVSEAMLNAQNLLLGDEITFKNVNGTDDKKLTVQIVGVFTEAEKDDEYWVSSPDTYTSNLFIATEDFTAIYMGDINKSSTVKCNWYTLVDVDSLTVNDASTVKIRTENFLSQAQTLGASVTEPAYLTVFEEYESKANRVMASLQILQVPILILLCAFLFMISGQMLSMEQNEISILKSRGASGKQIFMLYLGQSGLLTLISALVALPLGAGMCELLGSANAFLEFVRRRSLKLELTGEVFLYMLGACLVSILVTVIPVIRYSRVSIVNLKQKKNRSGRPLWQKLFLDFILLGISIYGYYVFSMQKEEMTIRVMSGSSLDPLLYLSSSIFIVGAGLFAMRLWPLFIKLIFRLVRKKVKPETYASYLQIIRTGNRQMFIMMFLVMTVALGIFNATVARTILSNAEENTSFRLGADLVMEEKWKDNSAAVKAGMADELVYTEPDFSRFSEVEGVKNITRVLNTSGSVDKTKTQVLGIITDEFGQVTEDTGLDNYALVDYLNVLSTNTQAVLVSESFRTYQGYKLGDTINLSVDGKTIVCTIYGFFNYFPTYVSSSVNIQGDGTAKSEENYMVVGNLSYLQSRIGVTPYELWVDTDEKGADNLASYISENSITMLKFDEIDAEYYAIRNETLFQGTNGILTMSFIIILILCGAGFLIYWILSIRERELLFGVFRAMGMSRKSIIRMLLNEQMLSSVIFIAVGAVIGAVVSHMFVPLIQIAYTADNQVLPLKLVTQGSDMVRLFLMIGIMFIICMVVLAKQVFSMKITNALKLGED